MKVIVRKGFYFSGKIKDLLRELDYFKTKYTTLRELINKSVH